MPQAQIPRVGALFEEEKAKRGKEQSLGPPAHEKVQQHRHPGKKLHRVDIEGFKQGKVKRHGCPSHGVGLTPDEAEVWVCDAANSHVHIFDNTVIPPKQIASIKLREQPGWITFSVDGRYAYPSTGDVIDTKTKGIVASLMDEEGREVHSEKVVELIFEGDELVAVGDQFGVGRKGLKR